ncbi:3'(2'),5'-bisphosphate nucleotidase CysQ [bacterium BMS3Abin15]|nr:3'(2'),5'-bisphosphate nucleotidase CysQ [bacterium BMS3Abin15]
MEISIEDIKKIAKKAGEEILKYYNSDYDISYKGEGKASPLTDADLASDKIIKDELEKYGIPILREESSDDKKRLNSEYVWVVDPLDGTSDFIKKTGEFVVSIGLVKNKQPILGVIYEPVIDRFFYAQKDKGAFMEERGTAKGIKVSAESDFSKMRILLSRSHLLSSDLKLCESLGIGEKIERGSVAKIALVAAGMGEIYVNTSDKTSEWDTCGGAVIVREAGGKITDMKGNDLVYNNDNPRHLDGFVVSNGTRHEDIINELKSLKV